MTPELRSRLERRLGSPPVAWQPRAGGYAANERWSVELADGRRVFVKHATAELLAGWLRAEARVYESVRGEFMPWFIAFDDDGDSPVLVLEDLSDAEWPPPWNDARVAAVRATLDEVHATTVPESLPAVDARIPTLVEAWDVVARDPEPFLSLGVADRAWLRAALPALRDAARAAVIDGAELIHFDVRSDNMCFARGRALLVDWNGAARGCGTFDLACWLPSLAAEGGPAPHEVLPDAPEYAALLAGFFGARAGLPAPATAPDVRKVQLEQLRPALAWARRELGV